MRVFIINTANMGPELRGGLIGVVGAASPSPEEKRQCVEAISRFVAEGWAIAADPRSTIGRLAAMTAEAGCVPFVSLRGVDQSGSGSRVVALPSAGLT